MRSLTAPTHLSSKTLKQGHCMRVSWDIFCRVIDNFGDIGVTWRLAQQLSQEHPFSVRLWVDDLSAFHTICSAVAMTAKRQAVAGVEICLWSEDDAIAQDDCADVVIEAFACQLPEDYIALMRSKQRVLWLNLEYLTAEPWAAECHALPSLQNGGLQKYFFFPGFTESTGGLLRESDLLSRRDTFLSSNRLRNDYLAALTVQPQPGERLISLFAYANQALPSWLDALSQDSRNNRLLVLQGPLQSSVAVWFAVKELKIGQTYQRGSLIVQTLPYLEQKNFDQLLWCCDLNCVRGEDSFVRAQWAAKNMLWHIYPQQEDVHLDKLEAFLSIYSNDLEEEPKRVLEAFYRAWNRQSDMSGAWQQFVEYENTLQHHAKHWSAQQKKHADLATKLACFYQDWL